MQPYFFPYLGYFQLMAKVGTFVIYDDVHFINRGWINRNRINIGGAAHMVTIPLQHASQNRLICDISTSVSDEWRGKILKTIRQAYAKASQFKRILPFIEHIVQYPAINLAEYLQHSLVSLRDHLGLKTEIISSSRQFGNSELKAQARIIDICQRLNADVYINPIGGCDLYDRSIFEQNALKLRFLTAGLPPYVSAADFIPGLSVIDVLMHCEEASVHTQLSAGTLS